MALSVFVHIEGPRSSVISKECSDKDGYEDYIEATEVMHAAEVPGDSVGMVQHQPYRIRKVIDRSSPLLIQALHESEKLTVVFNYFKQDEDDPEPTLFYTVTLKEATVRSYTDQVLFTKDSATAKHPPMEEVQFAFNWLEAKHVLKNTSYIFDRKKTFG